MSFLLSCFPQPKRIFSSSSVHFDFTYERYIQRVSSWMETSKRFRIRTDSLCLFQFVEPFGGIQSRKNRAASFKFHESKKKRIHTGQWRAFVRFNKFPQTVKYTSELCGKSLLVLSAVKTDFHVFWQLKSQVQLFFQPKGQSVMI